MEGVKEGCLVCECLNIDIECQCDGLHHELQSKDGGKEDVEVEEHIILSRAWLD